MNLLLISHLHLYKVIRVSPPRIERTFRKQSGVFSAFVVCFAVLPYSILFSAAFFSLVNFLPLRYVVGAQNASGSRSPLECRAEGTLLLFCTVLRGLLYCLLQTIFTCRKETWPASKKRNKGVRYVKTGTSLLDVGILATKFI